MKKKLMVALAGVMAGLLCIACAQTPAKVETRVLNGAFETIAENAELPDGWFYEAWDEDPAQGYAMFSEDDGGTAYLWSAGNDVRLCQTIAVKEKSFYKLTCRVRTSEVTGGAGANISVVGALAASQGVYGTGGWQTVELTGKTGKKQTELTVCVRIGGYGAEAAGGAWFDDVSVEYLEHFSGDAADFSVASVSAEATFAEGEIPYLAESCAALFFAACLLFFFYRNYVVRADTLTRPVRRERASLVCILVGAFLLRCVLSIAIYGHSTDISCFMAWGNALAENGIGAFYTSGMFADYPPGYMYVLWLTGSLTKMLRLSYGSAGHVLLTKMPAILADLGAAYIVYKLACKRRINTGKAPESSALPLVLAAVVAFNPAMAFISGGWGQIDQVLTLLLLFTILLFLDKKVILAGLVYGISILVKPQALMAGPLFAVAYFAYIKDEGLKGLWRTVAAVASAVAALFVLSLPFGGGQEPLWFLEKILGTATSYPYASIEAFNLFALLGGNWADVNETVFLLSYNAWGTIFICLSVAFSVMLYLKGRKREAHALTLSLAFLLTALFMLGQYMHERYLFPVLLLLAVSFVAYRDRRIFISFAWLTCSLLFNSLMAIIIVDHQEARGLAYHIATIAGSLLSLGGFAYLAYTCADILLFRRKHPAFSEKTMKKPPAPDALPQPVDNKLRFTKRDKLFCIALTAVYALVALINLGTTTAPETAWYGQAGDTYRIEFGQAAEIKEIRVFGGLYTGTITLTADDGTEYAYTEDNGDMFRWANILTEVTPAFTTTGFTLHVTSGTVWFNEFAFFDAEGNHILATAEGDAALLFDEPEQVPQTASYLNGMYFDELYHARTAYEHLHGLTPYENSHPPLGKVFIMLGIALFGMNAFGWRIVGTLFGIGMVPILYAFAKRLFKKSEYALLASALFAFDFMHFTQTRIATIDVYGVFFILLMYYYMYQYFSMNFFSDGLKKTLKPLALAGVFFGLGGASKWICFYAGAGLAVILFTSLVQRYLEYRRLRNSENEALRTAVKPFWKNAGITILWCCLFYILIPVAIYLLSYLPYVFSAEHYDLEGIWGVQKFMFNYHSGLTATHDYQSPWWQWPLLIRPMWYYVGYDVADGNIATISAMGNPAVWWVCSACTVGVAYSIARGKRKVDAPLFVLLVGLGANFLPWVLVSRCTFIYHFFASVPFILLITVYALQKKEERNPRYAAVKWVWLAVALILFAAFYPLISGLECSRAYVRFMEWLPSWTFMGI